MSSRTRKPAAASKKKRNKSPSPQPNARDFKSDINKLKQMNSRSFSETGIELKKEYTFNPKFSSLPNLFLASKPEIKIGVLLPAPDNLRTPRRLGIWKFISKQSISAIRQSTAEEARNILASLLEEKNMDHENIHLMTTLILTVLIWAFKKGFSDLKASTLAYCFMNTHEYFLDSSWRNQTEVYTFFKETLIHHTVEEPPLSNHIFTIYECKDCLSYFCDTYLPVLPLMRSRLIPNMRIELSFQIKNSPKI